MRNNYAFTVGCYFTVGTTNLNITYLGCYVYSGSTQTHRIGIWKKTDSSLLAVVTNNFSGKSAGFDYISLASPVTLTAGASYALGVEQFSGGDNWSDVSSVYTTTGAATNVQAAYATTGGTFSYPGAAGSALSQYVGVSFIYQ